MSPDELAAFGVFCRPAFLDADELRALVLEMRAAESAPTPVYLESEGGYVEADHVRSVRTVAVGAATRVRVDARLKAVIGELSTFFDEPLESFEPVSFLRYETGDHFVAHRDAEDFEERHRVRRVSIVVYLNGADGDEQNPEGFGGGELLLMVFGDDPRVAGLGVPVAPAPGLLVAFPSTMVHEVSRVTHGHRYTLVTWARSG